MSEVPVNNLISVDGRRVYEILEEYLKYDPGEFVVLYAREKAGGDPFVTLVAIILSQNTKDANSIKALQGYLERIGFRCRDALDKPLEDIMEAIKPAGLYRQKARIIKVVAEEYCKSWETVKKGGPSQVRVWLLSIPGVGKKTADVFLQVVYNAPVFAVDTHAARIAKRWGLVGEKASYDEVSKALLDFFGAEHAGEAHRLLIVLGRRYCKARRPRCSECPLKTVCPHALRQ